MKTITWKSQSGMNIKVDVCNEEFTIGGIAEIKQKHLKVYAYANDKLVGKNQGYFQPITCDNPTIVTMIGKLGLTQENLDKINAAISEVKPVINNIKSNNDVENAMTLNNTTY